MTAPRQQRKSALVLAMTLAALNGPGWTSLAARAAVDDRPLVDSHSGLAISGFDPVAYFTDGAAKSGRPDLELSQSGAIWRFRNEGNKAAFAERPDVYMPRFGGYDPVAIARGASVPGHPLFWAVSGQRLYLFYSEEARAAFAVDPGRIIATAERKWPTVARTIGR